MSFRFTVSLFEADRDAGSPDAADITAILRKSEREPVVLSLSDDGHESVRHLLELRIGDRPEPMSVEVNVPRWRMTFPVPDRFTARTFFQWLHFILPWAGCLVGAFQSSPAKGYPRPQEDVMVEKYIETLPFTASVFVVALTIVAVLVAVFLLFMRLLDDHPIVFVIVMVVITFLVFNFLLSLGGVA